ncbi:MAG: DUF4290 domain-containing protein [Paludibacteraceae bacterium]|nr:DUF4290 domain-containing protein [Paludibacteraceae bacterium]
MEYYTTKNKLILTEYGRNIQQMVEYAMTIEDRDERTRCVKTIINIMGNLFPHLRDVNDFKHKLWDHLAMMSNYQLDIDYPYEVVKPADLQTKPDKIPYPNRNIKDRHYGNNLPRFVKAATELENPELADKLIGILANQMKKYMVTWNKDNVEDQKIFDDIAGMTDGRIQLNENSFKLKESKDFTAPVKKKQVWNNHKNNYKK